MENVTAEKVDSEAAVLALLAKGSHARTIGETQARSCNARRFCIVQALCVCFKCASEWFPPECSCAVLGIVLLYSSMRTT